VRAGHFDVRIAVVLYGAKDRAGAARVLRESLSARERRLTDEERKWAATVFAEIGSAADVPLLETWSGSVREPGAIVETARAMMRLGNKKGVEMLVRIVEEKQEAEPPQPSAPGRLRPEGFHDGYRLVAPQASGDGFNAVDPPKGPFEGDRSGTPDRVAASVRAWWDKSRDEIEFDAKAGRWIAKPK
jgi:hypothetical protein